MYPLVIREMKRQKLRQADLAEYLGISAPALSQKLSGKVPLKIEECYQILRYLRIDASRLPEFFPPRKEMCA